VGQFHQGMWSWERDTTEITDPGIGTGDISITMAIMGTTLGTGDMDPGDLIAITTAGTSGDCDSTHGQLDAARARALSGRNRERVALRHDT
jgi:hypothetical protein